ncbi:unnamed protein product [Peronospora destructor]|uniref:Uncharacterized protein n=1 Tax=Peronospora destructor TaxID=86335 RepID=A0AAV0SVN4_9STRA|nr:unnamed protein product [Peronospora destructor]
MSASRLTQAQRSLQVSVPPWGAPGALLVGWMAWPALSPAFKEETLGITSTSSLVFGSLKQEIFRASGKYKYVKNEIGEAPTLEEEE